jgi:nucleoside 2-deoxyribosyltransferase
VVEIGYAYALKKPIVGVRTDFRASEDRGVNLMVSHACSRLVGSARDTAELAGRIM